MKLTIKKWTKAQIVDIIYNSTVSQYKDFKPSKEYQRVIDWCNGKTIEENPKVNKKLSVKASKIEKLLPSFGCNQEYVRKLVSILIDEEIPVSKKSNDSDYDVLEYKCGKTHTVKPLSLLKFYTLGEVEGECILGEDVIALTPSELSKDIDSELLYKKNITQTHCFSLKKNETFDGDYIEKCDLLQTSTDEVIEPILSKKEVESFCAKHSINTLVNFLGLNNYQIQN